MSLAYGYDVKDGDKILEAPVQASKIMTPLVVPGAVLVNYLPFCALSDFHPSLPVGLTSILSAIHSFMGPVFQLRTIGANSQEAE
jgi:hypothetical protein